MAKQGRQQINIKYMQRKVTTFKHNYKWNGGSKVPKRWHHHDVINLSYLEN